MKYLEEDLKRFLELAEQGASSYQCFLASAIISDNSHPDRVVQACKWAIIADCFSDPMAKPIVEFLQIGMATEDLQRAFDLAEDWIACNVAIANDRNYEFEPLNWTLDLIQASETAQSDLLKSS